MLWEFTQVSSPLWSSPLLQWIGLDRGWQKGSTYTTPHYQPHRSARACFHCRHRSLNTMFFPTELRSDLGFFTIYPTKQPPTISQNRHREWNLLDTSAGLTTKSICDWWRRQQQQNQENEITLKRSLSGQLSWWPLVTAIQQIFFSIKLLVRLFRTPLHNSIWDGNSAMMVNFMYQFV